MSRYALIQRNTGYVENVIEYEPETSDWTPPEGFMLIAAPDNGSPGDTYDLSTGVFAAPVPAPFPETPSLEQRLLDLEAWQKTIQRRP